MVDYDPPIDPAATAAALKAWFNRLSLSLITFTDAQIDAMRAAIEAALPHLTDADGMPLEPQTRIEKRFDGLVDVVLRMEQRLTDLNAKSALAVEARTDRIYRHIHQAFEAMAAEPVTAALETTGPTDYQVWRDALQLAASRCTDDDSRADLVHTAEWFREQLTKPRVQIVNNPDDVPPPGPIPTTAPARCPGCRDESVGARNTRPHNHSI
jgi:hypothetical protein